MPATSSWEQSAPRIADALAFALLAAVTVAAAATFRDYGLGWDDYTHSEYGELLYRLFVSGFTDRRALSFVNLYAYGGGFDLLAAIAAKILPFTLFETRRLVGALVGIVGLIAAWRIGRRVGGPTAGAITLLLLALCPLYYGHMFMNAKDAPFAVAMAIQLLALVRVVEDYPNPSPGSGALFAAGVGLALGTRVLGGFGAIYGLAALVFIIVVDARSYGSRAALARAGHFVLRLLPWLIPAYALMALIWPWSVVDPANPVNALLYFSHFFEKPWREVFDGAFILVPDMPRRYLPQLLTLKLPEIMVALGLAGLIGAAVAVLNGRLAPQRRAVFLILVLAAAFPIVLTVATRPAMYNGIRHFVFLTVPIAVLGGLAAGWLVDRCAGVKPALAGALVAVVSLATLAPAIEIVRLHPYQYTYFNHFAGGVAGARGRYMIDYWGLSFKQATEALRDKLATLPPSPSGRWHVATCGPHPPAKVGLGRGFLVDWNARGADFALVLGEYYCRRLDAPVVVDIAREGVVYARVYDIRGRNVEELLSIPAP